MQIFLLHMYLAFSIGCVFWSALPSSLCVGFSCGASVALCAFIPAPKVQDAQIQAELGLRSGSVVRVSAPAPCVRTSVYARV
jgi:hypothetical protein